mmetsp:Transcript_114303/g.262288  ORF Transcript_114303/g.262288 Transcript_114303/m.262288 type:complete len:204 (-) Transcript_114303:364-975(-)
MRRKDRKQSSRARASDSGSRASNAQSRTRRRDLCWCSRSIARASPISCATALDTSTPSPTTVSSPCGNRHTQFCSRLTTSTSVNTGFTTTASRPSSSISVESGNSPTGSRFRRTDTPKSTGVSLEKATRSRMVWRPILVRSTPSITTVPLSKWPSRSREWHSAVLPDPWRPKIATRDFGFTSNEIPRSSCDDVGLALHRKDFT